MYMYMDDIARYTHTHTPHTHTHTHTHTLHYTHTHTHTLIRICRYMRQTLLKRRIAVGAPIYLSAVLEYLCAEVLELAGNAATDNKRKVCIESIRERVLNVA